MHTITQTNGAPPAPTRDELVTALARYEARITAQAMRIAVANIAVVKAQTALAGAQAELDAAHEAHARLATYIADLTAQIGV